MKFVCEKDDLVKGIATVQRAMPARAAMSVLESIYMQATGGTLKLVCSDLALCIESLVPAGIVEDGEILVPGRLFSEVAKKLPQGPVHFEVEDNLAVRIEANGSRLTLQGMDAKEYPQMQAIDEKDPLEVKQSDFRNMISQTHFAVAMDESKPILTGELVEVSNGKLTVVALDGYRLGIRSCEMEKEHKDASFVMPGKSLLEISRLFEDGDAAASITVSNSMAVVDMGMTKITTRLLEGEYIKYQQILPKSYETRVRVETAALYESVERASLLAREGRNNLIKMRILDDKIVISANSELGSASEEIGVYMEGKDLEIAFNARYVLDVLKVIEEEEILLDFVSNLSPCVIKPVSGDSFLYLVLPVRIYS